MDKFIAALVTLGMLAFCALFFIIPNIMAVIFSVVLGVAALSLIYVLVLVAIKDFRKYN